MSPRAPQFTVLMASLALSPGAWALTRCEVMAHAEQWVNAGVIYSQGPGSSVCPGPMYADPWFGGTSYRPDCSGFVSAVWELPSPGHTTYSLGGGVWDDGVSSVIDPGELKPGDALNFGGNPSAGTGHVRLFGGWVGFLRAWGYEEIFCGQPARYWEEDWSNLAGTYQAIRLNGISECVTNAPPQGYLDGASPDGTHVGGWAFDPDTPDQALTVHVYFGGPTGDPAAVGVAATASGYRPDLCAALGSCAHGFDVAVPDAFRDGAPHPVYAYTFDSATGNPVSLSGCPVQIVSAPLPPPVGGPDAGQGGGEGPADAGVSGAQGQPDAGGEIPSAAADAGTKVGVEGGPASVPGPARPGCGAVPAEGAGVQWLLAVLGVALARRRR